MPLTFPELPDDILLLILANVHGKDALNIALTSKRLASLALPRVAAVKECWNPSMLRRLHAYMLSGEPVRASYLQRLTVEVHTFGQDDEAHNNDDEDENDDDDDGDDASSYYAADFSQAHLIGDILIRAHALQELSLERFQPCLARDPRIGYALGAMRNLRHLRLATIGDRGLSVLRRCGSSLRRLTLSYYVEEDYPLAGEEKTLPALMSALEPLYNLRILKLWNFTPREPLRHDPSAVHPELPSLTYLRLSDSSPSALDMVRFCPNLSTLIYSTDPEVESAAPPRIARAQQRWPPLRRLMLGADGDMPFVLDTVGRVDLLQISGRVDVGVEGDHHRDLLDLLRATSPVELYLSALLGRASMAPFWSRVREATQRLRVVELKVAIPAPALEYDAWLENLPDGLGPLAIPCLRLYVPRLERPMLVRFIHMGVDPADVMIANEEKRAEARLMEKRRLAEMRTLPQRLADAMPALRYLAILDEGPNEDNVTLSGSDYASGGEDDVHRARAYVWDDLRGTMCVKEPRWWRIVDGSSGRTLEEISEAEGEQAQERILGEDEISGRLASLSL